MSARFAAALLAAGVLLGSVPQLAAQDSGRLAVHPSLDAKEAAAGDRPIEVSVQYNFTIPMKTDSLGSQRESLENGRRMVYDIAAGECKVLLATIASTCELSRINVQSNSQRHSPMQEVATIGGNAAYRIRPKVTR